MDYKISYDGFNVVGESDDYISFYCPACELEDIEVEICSEYFDLISEKIICPECGAVINIVIDL